MARKSSRSAPAPKGRRETKAKSRRAEGPAAAAAEVEIVEEEKGLGLDDGIVLGTTLLLLVAWILTDYVLGTDYAGKGTGLFG
jgi:hypothetical protein